MNAGEGIALGVAAGLLGLILWSKHENDEAAPPVVAVPRVLQTAAPAPDMVALAQKRLSDLQRVYTMMQEQMQLLQERNALLISEITKARAKRPGL